MSKIELIQGDCLEKMKDIPDGSIDSIVTDPPYGLEFMGKHWDKGVPGVEFWQEMIRVLKPGGYLLAFGGTRTYHRMAVAIEDGGFEIRDMIEWVYGSGFPKSHNIGKAVDKLQGNEREVTGLNRAGKNALGQDSGWNAHENKTEFDITKGTSAWEGWGTALKPAHEPICMARKPLSEKTVAENVLKWGTGGINIDKSRVETSNINELYRKPTEYNDISPNAGMNASKVRGSVTDDYKLGRFPANLIHDNSEEVRECFPETKSVSGGTTSRTGNGLNFGMGTAPRTGHNDSGNASRFFKSIIYQAKASKAERNKGCEGLEEKEKKTLNDYKNPSEGRTASKSGSAMQNHHPTVKPIALMEYLINMVTKEGGAVLDPFMGSGTTGVACKNLNRNFIGIELDPDYFKIAEKRIHGTENTMERLLS